MFLHLKAVCLLLFVYPQCFEEHTFWIVCISLFQLASSLDYDESGFIMPVMCIKTMGYVVIYYIYVYEVDHILHREGHCQ